MEFPAWATPGEKRKIYGKAKGNRADELTLSDFDATTGFLEAQEGKFVFVLEHDIRHYLLFCANV